MNLKENNGIREEVAVAQNIEQFRDCIDRLKVKFEPYHNGDQTWWGETTIKDYNLSLPPWICQPYIRMEPEKHIERMAEKQRIANDPEREKNEYFDDDGQKISRKLMKKLKRSGRRSNTNQVRRRVQRVLELCSRTSECNNPMVNLKRNYLLNFVGNKRKMITFFFNFLLKGTKCDHRLCRICCRDKCFTDELMCNGHKFRIERRNRKGQKENSIADEINERDSLNSEIC